MWAWDVLEKDALVLSSNSFSKLKHSILKGKLIKTHTVLKVISIRQHTSFRKSLKFSRFSKSLPPQGFILRIYWEGKILWLSELPANWAENYKSLVFMNHYPWWIVLFGDASWLWVTHTPVNNVNNFISFPSYTLLTSLFGFIVSSVSQGSRQVFMHLQEKLHIIQLLTKYVPKEQRAA